MGISIMLFTIGVMLVVTGVALLVVKKRRSIAIVCVVVGVGLIILPPTLVMMSSM